ncbi:MAG: HEAT repeat domain-containing protein [Candidatus Wallbacteria bacterium]|nr:HEAT repeat domain-containing protein [Candidatus Wallbacteria bacterium]
MSETKQLLEMLRHSNPAVRRFALQRLGEAGDRTAILELRRATEDEDAGVASQAEKSLYLLLQRSTVGVGPTERVVSIPGSVAGKPVDIFEVDSLKSAGRALLRPHAARMAREVAGSDPALARACAAALGKVRDPDFIPALVAGLGHEDRRSECAYALAGFDEPVATRALLALLDAADRSAVRLGCFALGSNRQPEVTRRLVSLLMHPDPEVRADVVFALGECGDAQVARKIAPLLDDRSDQVVLRALAALKKLADPELQGAILARLPRTRSDKIRATLVGSLAGAQVEPRLLAALERAVQDTDTRVRANAVEVIGSLACPREDKVRLLNPVREDRNNRVMANLAIAMGPIDPLHSLRVLSEMLNSGDKWERASAVYAAGFIREQRVALWLANIFMFEEDADVLRNTVSSLSRFRGHDISEQLVKALRHHNPAVRSGSARVLGALGDRVGREALVHALEQENDPSVKTDILGALSKLCDASHIPAIATVLKDSSPKVQARGLEALEQIGSVEILPLVEPFLSSLDPRVKANAARALWKLGQLDVAAVLGGMLHSPNSLEVRSAVYALGELGDTLEVIADLRHYYLLASALRARTREPSPGAVDGAAQTPAPRILADLLDAELPLRHIYAGRYPEAINTLQAYLQSNPHSLPANFLVGDLYRRLENLELALKHLEACRGASESFVNLDLHLASVRAGLNDTSGSIHHYLAALRSKLEIVEGMLASAQELLRHERVGDASLLLKALVQQVPIDAKIHFKIGVQLLNNGIYEEALTHLFKALMADPKDVRILLQLGVLMARLGQGMVLQKIHDWIVELVGADDPIAREARKLLDASLESLGGEETRDIG